MPTENRSSNTEMVSVPREAVVQAAELLQEYNKCSIARDLRAILAQPAVQHQGEPVALPARKDPTEAWAIPVGVHKAEGWNACLDEIAKLGPLYSRPVQDEPVAWRGLNDLGEVVTEWIDGVPPESIVDLCGNPASFAKIEQAYSHADPGEAERLRKEVAELEQLRRDDLGRHLITEVKTESQLAECEAMAAMIAEREWAEHAGTGPVSSKVEAAFTQLHNDLHEASDKLAERDALLRDKSGDLIRMAAHLISAPLLALQELQDEDKKMTRARVDHAVDVADARLKDAAYELRRIADALSASAEPSAPVDLCRICKGYGKYQDGDSGTDEDGRCPNIVECECDDSERIPQYRASAPVEIDEQAQFMAWANKEYEVAPDEELNLKNPSVRDNKIGWLARAALERKQ
ncbi:hypothetical protein [Pseudomonas juntendi]|uniref:Uncharacterized protein n=1 Tax=Pseudomonas juntendi TaxID=2666183 RepID=A0AAJ5S145_9PSED|nr:hypothetical protein [Pseudomonas juntendi]WEA18670.1 hypothetical protein PWA60_15275 [Pseudomonas juntendi]